MKSFLVGCTGFVGSNLKEQYKFSEMFHSTDIEKAFYQKPDLLVYAGIPAQKFIANNNPEEDLKIIKNAIENIKKIEPKKIVLISTIDVYPNPINVDEEDDKEESEEAYGKNRKYLENWVKENFEEYLIVRLPGLYGKNLKKNFIYDLIHYIPSLLKKEKYEELLTKNGNLKNYYFDQGNGFYKCKELSDEKRIQLKEMFKAFGFSALNFTDSRGSFQFYNLSYLWKHIQIALEHNIKVLNLATEPIKISELYEYIYQEQFKNELNNKIPNYNFKTKYDTIFHGKNGYILNKDFLLEDIKNYVLKPKKICISNIAWDDSNDLEMYQFLKEKDIHYIEIAPTRLVGENPYEHLEDAKKIQEELKKTYHLEIGSMQSIWFGKTKNIFESDENFNELLEYTKKAIDFAKTINCPNIVFGNPKNRNMNNFEQDYKKAILFFQELGKYAEDKNVVIAIEPNPTIYNTNFLTTTKEAIAFVKEINLPNIKINYDLGTVIENNESLEILESNLNLINHIHISEPNLALIEERELHSKLLEILVKGNYNNLISIEMKKNDINNVKQTICYLNELYSKFYK